MAGIMQHAGYLDDDKKVTTPALVAFLNHRNAIITGQNDDPFPLNVSLRNDIAPLIYLEDKDRFPTFFEKWTGILETSLNLLNLESNISVPFFDPTALAAKLDLKSPQFSFGTLLGILASQTAGPPVSFQVALLSLTDIQLQDIPGFIDKIEGEIIKIPQAPNPADFIPAIPSLSFPTLTYTVPVFNLRDKQIALYTSLPQILFNLFAKFATAENISKFAIDGPSSIIKLGYETLKDSLPRPPGINNTTNDVNLEALARTLTKPIVITPIGLTVGSSEGGITGNLGAQEPDSMKTIEQPKEDDTSVLNAGTRPDFNLSTNTTPAFRKKLVEIAKELGISPDPIAICMALETVNTFDPAIRAARFDENGKLIEGDTVGSAQTNPASYQTAGSPYANVPPMPPGWRHINDKEFADINTAAKEVLSKKKTLAFTNDKNLPEQITEYFYKLGEGEYRVLKNNKGEDVRVLFRIEVHFDGAQKPPEYNPLKGIKESFNHHRRGVTVYVKKDPTAQDPILAPVSDPTKPQLKLIRGKPISKYKGNEGPAVGLIQFTSRRPDPKNKEKFINGAIEELNLTYNKNYTKEMLANMKPEEQLEVVKEYFQNALKKFGVTAEQINNAEKVRYGAGAEILYMLVFMPAQAKNVTDPNKEVLSRDKAAVDANRSNGVVKTDAQGEYLSRSRLLGAVRQRVSNSLNLGRVYADRQQIVPGSNKY